MTPMNVWFVSMVVWVIGLFLNATNTTKYVHTSFKKMWGMRLEAVGVLLVLCTYTKENLGDWNGFDTFYVILMSFIFLSTAYSEYRIREIFIEQVNKMK